MRPVTVTVGPLATAVANNICTTQTPGAGNALVLNGTLVTKMFQGTGSISGNVLTITAVTSGVLNIRDLVSGSTCLPNTYVMGVLGTTTNGVGTYVVNVAQTVSSTTIYANAVATLDKPRRVLITPTADESANTFTITGTGPSNEPVTEVLTGANAAAFYSVMDYSTVTQIVATNLAGGALTVGTNGVASSMWVRLDEYAFAPAAMQVSVTGTVNYTIEQCFQQEGNPLFPYQMTWLSTGVIGGTTSQVATFTNAPTRIRVTLNSGTGSLSAVTVQNANAPY